MRQPYKVLGGGICPHIDRDDGRCESRLSLVHLRDAFDLCICNYHHCPVYRQIKHEQFAHASCDKLAAAVVN